jgi:hypothetical protein
LCVAGTRFYKTYTIQAFKIYTGQTFQQSKTTSFPACSRFGHRLQANMFIIIILVALAIVIVHGRRHSGNRRRRRHCRGVVADGRLLCRGRCRLIVDNARLRQHHPNARRRLIAIVAIMVVVVYIIATLSSLSPVSQSFFNGRPRSIQQDCCPSSKTPSSSSSSTPSS